MDAPKSNNGEPYGLPPVNPFADVAELRGLSGQFLFLRDCDSKPGKAICHFVRVETIEFDVNDDTVPSMAKLNGADASDPRLVHLGTCYTGPANDVIQALVVGLKGTMVALTEILRLPIAVGTQALRIKWSRSAALGGFILKNGRLPEPPQAQPVATIKHEPPKPREKLERCNEDLKAAGLPTPRTCEKCGLGPCRVLERE